jgi:hypothetical protein
MALSDSRWLHAEVPAIAPPAVKAFGKSLSAGVRRALWLA